MTAREVIMYGNEGYSFRDVIDNLTQDDIISCMNEYARAKCEELLEIVAEKAKAKIEYEYEGNTGSEYCYEFAVVDKDSILNAADLETFCS